MLIQIVLSVVPVIDFYVHHKFSEHNFQYGIIIIQVISIFVVLIKYIQSYKLLYQKPADQERVDSTHEYPDSNWKFIYNQNKQN